MSLLPVGILGGMGPEGTILFQQKLLAAVNAADDADHIPLLIDMNTQVPSRIAHLIEKTGTDPTPTLVKMAKDLESVGATAIAMPCNTAHCYSDAIKAAVSIPFLDMIDLAVDQCVKSSPDRGMIGMLASPAVQMTGLFDAALAARGLRAVWPDEDDMDALLSDIRIIKRKGSCFESTRGFYSSSQNLIMQGATTQLVACTEFSLAVDMLPKESKPLDALDALVEAVRDHSRGIKGG